METYNQYRTIPQNLINGSPYEVLVMTISPESEIEELAEANGSTARFTYDPSGYEPETLEGGDCYLFNSLRRGTAFLYDLLTRSNSGLMIKLSEQEGIISQTSFTRKERKLVTNISSIIGELLIDPNK